MLVKPHETETRVWFVPVFGDPALIARKNDLATVISIDEGDAAVEPLGWSASSLGWFRRRLTPLRRTVLNFDGVEIFPKAPRAERETIANSSNRLAPLACRSTARFWLRIKS